MNKTEVAQALYDSDHYLKFGWSKPSTWNTAQAHVRRHYTALAYQFLLNHSVEEK